MDQNFGVHVFTKSWKTTGRRRQGLPTYRVESDTEMASHLGYSEEVIAELGKQEIYSSSNVKRTEEKSSLRSKTQLFTCSILSIVSLVLIIFGISYGHQPLQTINRIIHTNLALLTNAEVLLISSLLFSSLLFSSLNLLLILTLTLTHFTHSYLQINVFRCPNLST